MIQTKIIESTLLKYPKEKIFKSSTVYKKNFIELSEQNYYKVIERMVKKEILVRVAKGIYYVPKRDKYGICFLNKKKLLNQIAFNNEYISVGYDLYNKYSLSTQVSKKSQIYVKKNLMDICKYNNLIVKELKINYSNENEIKIIETLEILQNFSKIEDINLIMFDNYISKISSFYSDLVLDRVLKKLKIQNISYKKSTLAFLEEILTYKNIKNNVSNYLSRLSKYEKQKWVVN